MTGHWRLIESDSKCSVVDRLEVADRYWSRLVGLQLRPEPPPGFGLLLVPCSSIHTCFMRFSIDLLSLDRDGRVIDVHRGVRPWRIIVPARPTFAIVEIPSRDGGMKIKLGATLRLEPSEKIPRRIPGTLAAWCQEI
jgi:uncharacterized protein